jgi:hypothetical protein
VGAKSTVDQIKAKLMLNHEVSSNAMHIPFVTFLSHFIDVALPISHRNIGSTLVYIYIYIYIYKKKIEGLIGSATSTK